MAADWAYYPLYDSSWDVEPPPTLITRLSDGKSIRRQKHANSQESWTEVYPLTGAQLDVALAFYRTKYFLTSFTKQSYDVAGTPLQERTVYFASKWRVVRAGPDYYQVTLDFELAI